MKILEISYAAMLSLQTQELVFVVLTISIRVGEWYYYRLKYKKHVSRKNK